MRQTQVLIAASILLAVPAISNAGRLYWTDPTYRAVQSMNLEDLSVSTIVDDIIGPVGQADVVEGRVWWFDFQRGMIRRYRVGDGFLDSIPLPDFGVTVESLGFTPVPALGKIYWGVTVRLEPLTANFEYSIWRTNLDGSNPENLLTRPGHGARFGVDTLRDRIYWRDTQSNTIWRATLDGTDVQPFLTLTSYSWFYTVDEADGSLYFLAEGPGGRSVRRVDVNGTGMQTLVGPHAWLSRFALDRVRGNIYWEHNSDLWRSNLDGSGAMLFLQSQVSIPVANGGSIAVDENQGVAYAIQGVYRLISTSTPGTYQTLLTSQCRAPHAITLGTNPTTMFWADVVSDPFTTTTVFRANLDGTNIAGLGSAIAVSLEEGMVFDKTLNMVYFSQNVYEGNEDYSCAIQRRPYSGSGTTETLYYEEGNSYSKCDFSLAIDHAGQKLYFAYGGAGRIYRSNLDGASRELLIDMAPILPTGLAINALDGYYYWTGADTGGGGTVGRAALGSTVAEIVLSVAPSLGRPQGIAVDGGSEHIYFSTDVGSIQRCGLNGTDVIELLAPGTSFPTDLALLPVASPPQFPPAPHDIPKNRYVSFAPVNPGAAVAFQVTLVSNGMQPGAVGEVGWVGEPNASGLAGMVASPVYREWTEDVVHVGGCGVIPAGTYEIRAQSPGGLPTPPIVVTTTAQPLPKAWGDVTGGFNGIEWTAPNGIMNVGDVLSELATISGSSGAPHPSRTDLQSVTASDSCLNRIVNVADVLASVKAAQGDPFPFVTDPTLCPDCP